MMYYDSSSVHTMMYLILSYRQKLKTAKTQTCIVRLWDQDSIQQFLPLLCCTDWASFAGGTCVDLHEYTDGVTSYVHSCEDLCIPNKKIKSWANDKPWFKSGLKSKLKAKEAAHKSGDRVLYKNAQYDVQREIR